MIANAKGMLLNPSSRTIIQIQEGGLWALGMWGVVFLGLKMWGVGFLGPQNEGCLFFREVGEGFFG